MISFPESICPLCSQLFLREELFQHISCEHDQLRERTIRMIQAYHAGWLAEHGACGSCWRSFREAGRVLSMLKHSRTIPPNHYQPKPKANVPEPAVAEESDLASIPKPSVKRQLVDSESVGHTYGRDDCLEH